MATGEGSKSCPRVLFSVAVVGTLERVRELGTPYSAEMPSTVPGVKDPEVWLKVNVAAGELRARFPEITLLAGRLIVPPAWIPKLAIANARLDDADTSPPARIATVETLFVKVRLLVTSSFPPVSNLSVLAVIVPSSAAVRDNVPVTSVPAVSALEDVNGSNLTAPVPVLIEPVKLTLFERTVTSVFVTDIGTPTVNAASEDVEASKTSDTEPEELNDPGWKAASSLTTVPDLVAEKLKPPEPAAIDEGEEAP